jgi:hypothetical protein
MDMGSIRSFDIKNIRDKRSIHTFIETGTLYGDGVDYAIDSGFKRIISIEINEELVKKAKIKYANNSNVEILLGNSPDVLEQLLPSIAEPVLFWLDAHFPGCDANLASYRDELNNEKRVPLESELKLISQRAQQDVIICDDLWIYEDWETSTGTFNTHCKKHGHDITREELCKDVTLNTFKKMFHSTHELSTVYIDQGFIVLKPNK